MIRTAHTIDVEPNALVEKEPTVAQIAAAIGVIATLTAADATLPMRSLTLSAFPDGGIEVAALGGSREGVKKWAEQVGGDYRETPHERRIHCRADGSVLGIRVEAFCIVDPEEAGEVVREL